MKKLIFFLSLIMFFSCEKDECKTCVTTYYASGASIGVELNKWVECDMREIVEQYPPYNFPLTITKCK